ncbi:MAG TPA: carboxypeptidase-like regulatory domain-containing protein, partial [Longimicrobiales bacterium]|nr:carboxypeptidase-like regulatory domain-containing protein [Longimicrobiales bacterium]
MSRRTQFRVLLLITLAWLGWAGWSVVGGPDPFTIRVLDDTGQPVPEAVVASGSHQLGITGEDGTVDIRSEGGPIKISAPGHVSSIIASPQPERGTLNAVLKARVLRGRVVDPAGRPVADAVVDAGFASATSDASGSFAVRGAEPGLVSVSRPAWREVSFDWKGGPGEKEIVAQPAIFKTVHVTGEAVEKRFDEF